MEKYFTVCTVPTAKDEVAIQLYLLCFVTIRIELEDSNVCPLMYVMSMTSELLLSPEVPVLAGLPEEEEKLTSTPTWFHRLAAHFNYNQARDRAAHSTQHRLIKC
jgi:hypothetical protein